VLGPPADANHERRFCQSPTKPPGPATRSPTKGTCPLGRVDSQTSKTASPPGLTIGESAAPTHSNWVRNGP
jgi:hypothetical protein